MVLTYEKLAKLINGWAKEKQEQPVVIHILGSEAENLHRPRLSEATRNSGAFNKGDHFLSIKMDE